MNGSYVSLVRDYSGSTTGYELTICEFAVFGETFDRTPLDVDDDVLETAYEVVVNEVKTIEVSHVEPPISASFNSL